MLRLCCYVLRSGSSSAQDADGKAAESVAAEQHSISCPHTFAGEDVFKFRGSPGRKLERDVFPNLSCRRPLLSAHQRVREPGNSHDHRVFVLFLLEHTGEGTYMLIGA